MRTCVRSWRWDGLFNVHTLLLRTGFAARRLALLTSVTSMGILRSKGLPPQWPLYLRWRQLGPQPCPQPVAPVGNGRSRSDPDELDSVDASPKKG